MRYGSGSGALTALVGAAAIMGTAAPTWADDGLSEAEQMEIAFEQTPVVLDRLCMATAGAHMGSGEYDAIAMTRLVIEMIVQSVQEMLPADAGAGGKECLDLDDEDFDGELDGLAYEGEIEDLEVCFFDDGSFGIWLDHAEIEVEGGFLESLFASISEFHFFISPSGFVSAELEETVLDVETTAGGELSSILEGFLFELDIPLAPGDGEILIFEIDRYALEAEGDIGSLEFELDDFELVIAGANAAGIDITIALGLDEAELEIEAGDDEFELEADDVVIICNPVPNCVEADGLVLNPPVFQGD